MSARCGFCADLLPAIVAARRGVVLLSAGSVVAGAGALTTEVEAVMAELAVKEHSPNEKGKIK